MSVKDWWVGPREHVLNVPIACWYMGPVSLVSGCQQKLDFSPLLHWLLWQRSWVRTCGSGSHRPVDCVVSPCNTMFSQRNKTPEIIYLGKYIIIYYIHAIVYILWWWCVLLYFIVQVGIVQKLNSFWIQIGLYFIKGISKGYFILVFLLPWAKIYFGSPKPAQTAPTSWPNRPIYPRNRCQPASLTRPSYPG
jgi:hypothetical protein